MGRIALTAAICGETRRVKIQHMRALKDLKGKNQVEKLMIAAKIKQIPLCYKHHL